jgi:hypothetical protein
MKLTMLLKLNQSIKLPPWSTESARENDVIWAWVSNTTAVLHVGVNPVHGLSSKGDVAVRARMNFQIFRQRQEISTDQLRKKMTFSMNKSFKYQTIEREDYNFLAQSCMPFDFD